MADDFDHCAELVRAADKDRFLATLFAPEKYRRPLYALYAFNAELARVRDVARESMPGELRLQWWRDALTGRPGRERGPVAATLAAVIVRYRLPLPVLDDMIEARSFDLYDDPMGTMQELEGYAAKTSAAVMALAARILSDGNDPGIDAITPHAGVAYALAGLLSAFPTHAARRQLYVPLEVLQRHGANPEDAFARKPTVELKAALDAVREVARRHLVELRPLIPHLPVVLLPALLPVAVVGPTLRRLDRGNPFVHRPLPQWRRQWLLWRAARNPNRLAAM